LREGPTVSISDYSIAIDNDLENLTFLRDEIQEIYYDKDNLVIIGTTGHELLRESYDIKEEKSKNAFRNHNYPFSLTDPYKTYFKLWSASTDELSTTDSCLSLINAIICLFCKFRRFFILNLSWTNVKKRLQLV